MLCIPFLILLFGSLVSAAIPVCQYALKDNMCKSFKCTENPLTKNLANSWKCWRCDAKASGLYNRESYAYSENSICGVRMLSFGDHVAEAAFTDGNRNTFAIISIADRWYDKGEPRTDLKDCIPS